MFQLSSRARGRLQSRAARLAEVPQLDPSGWALALPSSSAGSCSAGPANSRVRIASARWREPSIGDEAGAVAGEPWKLRLRLAAGGAALRELDPRLGVVLASVGALDAGQRRSTWSGRPYGVDLDLLSIAMRCIQAEPVERPEPSGGRARTGPLTISSSRSIGQPRVRR